jgi:hypothetical protein
MMVDVLREVESQDADSTASTDPEIALLGIPLSTYFF